MGNTFNKRNWILDTADTAELLLGITYPITINRIEWHPGAAAQSLVIKDRHAEVKNSKTSLAVSPAGDEVFDYAGGRIYDGFVLHTMTGGTLYVDLE